MRDPLVPRICACCASTADVERHHLYSVKDGCPDDLQIWLCRVCHERVHDIRSGGLHHHRLTREGLAAAKARGKRLGGYRGNPPPDAALGAAARRDAADAFAARVRPTIEALRAGA